MTHDFSRAGLYLICSILSSIITALVLPSTFATRGAPISILVVLVFGLGSIVLVIMSIMSATRAFRLLAIEVQDIKRRFSQ